MVKVVTVVVLGVVLVAAVAGLTVVAVFTDRDLGRAEMYTFGSVALLVGLGGLSWWTIRRRRWHVDVTRDNGPPTPPPE